MVILTTNDKTLTFIIVIIWFFILSLFYFNKFNQEKQKRTEIKRPLWINWFTWMWWTDKSQPHWWIKRGMRSKRLVKTVINLDWELGNIRLTSLLLTNSRKITANRRQKGHLESLFAQIRKVIMLVIHNTQTHNEVLYSVLSTKCFP